MKTRIDQKENGSSSSAVSDVSILVVRSDKASSDTRQTSPVQSMKVGQILTRSKESITFHECRHWQSAAKHDAGPEAYFLTVGEKSQQLYLNNDTTFYVGEFQFLSQYQ
jgi:hypothetical protein